MPDDATRRAFLGTLAAASVAGAAPEAKVPTLAFSDRAHFLARPEVRDTLIACFRDTLGCGAPMLLHAPGVSEPIAAFRFPNGGSVSIEFTADALDAATIRRGAWLEIRSGDPDALQGRILAAGFERVHHPATNTFYFAAPGGQVFGIVPVEKLPAGELKR